MKSFTLIILFLLLMVVCHKGQKSFYKSSQNRDKGILFHCHENKTKNLFTYIGLKRLSGKWSLFDVFNEVICGVM